MAGVIHGKIDMRCGDGVVGPEDVHQEMFKGLFDFLDSQYTRVALQYGAGGTGTDYWDGVAPFGENAFAVFRATSAANPFDILIQWATDDNFGTAPGNPGEMGGTAFTNGVGITIALREDGSSPWAGGTANAGADSKAATVWTAGGSVLHVLDRSCSTGGSFATNLENLSRAMAEASFGGFVRVHLVGDDDGIAILSDRGDDGEYVCQYLGAYTLRDGSAGVTPICAVMDSSTGPWTEGEGTLYGTLAGNSSQEGGMLGANNADLVRSISVGGTYSTVYTSAFQPNSQLAVPELDGFEIPLLFREVNQGLAGQVPAALLNTVFGISNLETNTPGTRAYMATSTLQAIKFSIPWDGLGPPGVNNTRAGRTF